MKKIGKGAAYVVISLILLVIIVVSYVVLALPNVGKPETITVAITPERVARGKYLANYVTLCTDCHSQRDWSKKMGPVDPDKFGAGGTVFSADDNIPGTIYSPNITPSRLKEWSDGEILRAITTGESRDG